MKIEEMIVVEGKDDTVAIKRAVDADTIETNGSAISSETLIKIRHAQQKRGVIVFTDPDYPGRRIRAIIEEQIPGVKHAFLPKEQAIAKNGKGLGIEHASNEAIREALQHVHTPSQSSDHPPIISKHELVRARLIGTPDAAMRRNRIGDILQIGQMNGKQLEKRLHAFRISREQFEQALQQIEQEGLHE